MRALRLFLICGVVFLMASCQTSRSAFQPRPFGQVAALSASTDSTVLLLHDSQGPQATRVQMTAAEAATLHQQ
ncbi:hypothetical protein [Hymenobacter sp. DG01]|uniref:hypothetical protein n=1 Tax=Hymenobacter sp. DG01 TaxID=2584940 RepID=UPI0011218FF4|nr:hypothetical protein [Hymenobacter sp. DG01]